MVLPRFWGYSLCHHGWPGHSRHLFLDSRIFPLCISIADSGPLAMKVLLPYLGQKSVWCILQGLSCVFYSAPLLHVYICSLAILLSSHFILSLFWNCFYLFHSDSFRKMSHVATLIAVCSGRSNSFTMGLPYDYFLRVSPHTAITFVTHSHMFTLIPFTSVL